MSRYWCTESTAQSRPYMGLSQMSSPFTSRNSTGKCTASRSRSTRRAARAAPPRPPPAAPRTPSPGSARGAPWRTRRGSRPPSGPPPRAARTGGSPAAASAGRRRTASLSSQKAAFSSSRSFTRCAAPWPARRRLGRAAASSRSRARVCGNQKNSKWRCARAVSSIESRQASSGCAVRVHASRKAGTSRSRTRTSTPRLPERHLRRLEELRALGLGALEQLALRRHQREAAHLGGERAEVEPGAVRAGAQRAAERLHGRCPRGSPSRAPRPRAGARAGAAACRPTPWPRTPRGPPAPGP